VTLRKIIRKPVVIKDGYIQVSLDKDGERKCVGLHIIVAKTFLPNPENKPIVNHESNAPANNCVWNLNWATNSENQKHAVKMGVKKVGCEFTGSKLTEKQVRYIRGHYIPRHCEFGQAAFARGCW